MSGKIDKDGVYKFLRRLQHELGNTFYDLKDDFEKTPPSNNQIRQRFLEWKGKYDQLVVLTFKEVHEIDQKIFDFRDFIVKITEDYGGDSEFMELLKGLNNSIEALKDYIRNQLIKDPTIYDMESDS